MVRLETQENIEFPLEDVSKRLRDYKLCIYILVSIPQTRLKSSDLIRSLSKVNIRTYP